MARGDQFALILNTIFLMHSAAAFVVFAGLVWLLGRALKRSISWRVAGTIGVAVWVIRNIYVHAMDSNVASKISVDGIWFIVIPAIFLLGVIWMVRLVVWIAK